MATEINATRSISSGPTRTPSLTPAPRRAEQESNEPRTSETADQVTLDTSTEKVERSTDRIA